MPGLSRIFVDISLPETAHKLTVAVWKWCFAGNLTLRHIYPTPSRLKRKFLISVDVEALPGRAPSNHIDTLIYGRFGTSICGISLLCDIVEEYGVRPTFFVDYATCECHGELPIFGVTEYLLRRNMDVQLHMHCEVLIKERKWESRCGSTPFFDSLPYDLALEVIEFGRNKYHDNTGTYPRIFRPGGMKRNIAMYQACKSLGFEAVSAIYQGYDRKCWKDFGHKGLVQFDNGIIEMPLDFALDPIISQILAKES
jgi:hypothetical protein